MSLNHIYLRALRMGDGEYLDAMSDTSFRFTAGEIPPVPDLTSVDYSLAEPIPRISFAIIYGHQLVGEVIFAAVDLLARRCRLSIGIARKDHRGQGIGNRALNLALTYAFYSLGLKTVSAETWADNSAAVQILRKGGFRETGSEFRIHSGDSRPSKLLHFTITLTEFNDLKNTQ